jgi:hypothetical protein
LVKPPLRCFFRMKLLKLKSLRLAGRKRFRNLEKIVDNSNRGIACFGQASEGGAIALTVWKRLRLGYAEAIEAVRLPVNCKRVLRVPNLLVSSLRLRSSFTFGLS